MVLSDKTYSRYLMKLVSATERFMAKTGKPKGLKNFKDFFCLRKWLKELNKINFLKAFHIKQCGSIQMFINQHIISAI